MRRKCIKDVMSHNLVNEMDVSFYSLFKYKYIIGLIALYFSELEIKMGIF